YFHNWTGNRITCRDWFQLCLKEGLTVYRDQEFTKAMRSPAVARPSYTALPAGFYEERIAGGLKLPTSLAVASDGRIFITEKAGRVRVVAGGVLQDAPFIDLSNEVNAASDRGLMGVAVHPRFPALPYVYLAYTYDPPETDGYPESGSRVARLLRVEADRTNLNLHKAGSGVVILGTNSTFANIGNPELGDTEPFSCFDDGGGFVRDCLPTEGTAHTLDFMKFGRDGSLYVSMGDGIVNSKGNWRAQDVNSLAGKILRIDPLTGNGYASNPFFDGDVTSNRSKVYSLGLRNPFRFTLHPATGNLFIGEVGNNAWEEINRGRAGTNFGWPCYEGQEQAASFPICDPLFSGASKVTHSVYAYPHKANPPRGSAIGGDFYTGMSYPAPYRGAYFFTDFNGGIIHTMTFSRDGTATVSDFASAAPGPIQISMGPDGNLWMLYIATGELIRLRYSGAAQPATTPTPGGATSGSAGSGAVTGATGQLLFETWQGVSGVSLADLTNSANYPDKPSKSEMITNLDAPRLDTADSGHRIRGYIHPQISGQYRFWIASDDAG
ncbi:MAG TPA: PQQ-dependent sugar dehydrogenase, partial [Promineifilum sp.]|nr:PQQ-dependent sugar dehydrogenase [Promineifilum sp.]